MQPNLWSYVFLFYFLVWFNESEYAPEQTITLTQCHNKYHMWSRGWESPELLWVRFSAHINKEIYTFARFTLGIVYIYSKIYMRITSLMAHWLSVSASLLLWHAFSSTQPQTCMPAHRYHWYMIPSSAIHWG